MADAAETFRGLGASVEEVQLSPLLDFHACNMIIMLSEALAIHEPDLQERADKYGELFRDRVILGSVLSAIDHAQALRRRRQLAGEVSAALEQVDVLITAGGWAPAPPMDAIPKFYLFERPLITTPFNVSGHPVVSVCNGFSAEGLPVGMQVVGRAFDEVTALRVATAFEEATPYRDRRPGLADT